MHRTRLAAALRSGLVCLLLLLPCLALAEIPDNSEKTTSENSQQDTSETTNPAQPFVERAQLSSRAYLNSQQLQRQYPDQFVELHGSDTIGALYLPANQIPANGSVIFIPGLHESADTPLYIARLRRSISDKGWNSLSLNLPDPPFQALRILGNTVSASLPEHETPETTDKENNHAEQSDIQETQQQGMGEAVLQEANNQTSDSDISNMENATANHAQSIQKTLATALEYVQRHEPPSILVIAQHEGAYWLLDFLNQNPQSGIDAVLLINPRTPQQAQENLATLITPLNIPIADYFYIQDTAQHEDEAAKQRLNAALRNPRNQYRQVKLTEHARQLRAEQVNNRVLGWLYQYKSPKKSRSEDHSR